MCRIQGSLFCWPRSPFGFLLFLLLYIHIPHPTSSLPLNSLKCHVIPSPTYASVSFPLCIDCISPAVDDLIGCKLRSSVTAFPVLNELWSVSPPALSYSFVHLLVTCLTLVVSKFKLHVAFQVASIRSLYKYFKNFMFAHDFTISACYKN